MSKKQGEKCRIVDGRIEHHGYKTEECSSCKGSGRSRFPTSMHTVFHNPSPDDEKCIRCGGSGQTSVCQCGGSVHAYTPTPYHCAIATATLGIYADCELNRLRGFRDRMARNWLGGLFAKWYERIKNPVAIYIADKPRHKWVILHLFIQPTLMLQPRLHGKASWYADLICLVFYVSMLVWASLVDLLATGTRNEKG